VVSRKTVSRLLIAYLCVVWGAVLVRSDRFPLTWAPMYSRIGKPRTEVSSRIADHEVFNRGLLVTRRDGSTGYVGREALNIPRANMYRLYYSRSRGKPAAKHANANLNLSAPNRWLRGLEPAELAIPNDTKFQVFRSLNKTLGLEPDDPRFIVRARSQQVRVFRRLDDLSQFRSETRDSDIHWQEVWRERW
jgi:hypothetical protein